MKRSFFLFCAVLTVQLSFSNLLYDIVDGKYDAEKYPALSWMKDGEHYALQLDSTTIVKYHVKDSRVADTLFNIKSIKNCAIRSITGYELSPDEKMILVRTNEEKRYRRSFIADYYIYNIEKKRLTPLSEYGKQEAPLFSPNSRYVAFARENNLFMRKLDFNTEIAITKDGEKGKVCNGIAGWLYEEEFEQVRYFEWSPDSKLLAYVKFDESKVGQYAYPVYQKESAADKDLTLYPSIEQYKYPKAGQNNPGAAVYIYEDYNKNNRLVNLDAKNFYIPRIVWTNSPDQLAVFTLNRDQNHLTMFLVNAKSTVATSILTEDDKSYIDYRNLDYLQFASDNTSFIYVSERGGYRHAYRYRINGLLDKQLTRGAYDITDVYGYDEKNNLLYYQSAEPSPLQRSIYAVDMKGNKKLLTEDQGVHNASFAPGFNYFVDYYSSINVPGNVQIRTSKGNLVQTLKQNIDVQNKFEALNLPKKEFFSFTTTEDIKLNGWMLKPKNMNPNKKYPLLLVQYSGPDSQMVLDEWNVGWEYFLAENGFVVACVDGRGTGGRGTKFRKCTYQQLGLLETRDQIETARYLGSQSYVDKGRIGIWGWSFGGFITLTALSSPGDVFKAGISIAPVTDWRLYDTAYSERYMRRPQENFKGYNQSSAILNANNLNGNLLIVHGTADDNVHLQNTMLYIDALVNAGKQFEMQLYTDKNHALSGEATRHHLYTRMYNFLLKNL